jgi:AcrR family transcriptional regulator
MSEDTRQKIVEAAYRALVRDGYSRTTVKDIAEEAKIAPGLVHYYFKTKEELLVAAINFGCSDPGLTDRALELNDPMAAAMAGIETEKTNLRNAPEPYLLVFDMFGEGLHNPVIAAAVRSFIDERRGQIQALGEMLLAVSERKPRAPLTALAGAIWGSVVGISLQRLIDPDFDSDAALDALAEMAFSLLPIREGVG